MGHISQGTFLSWKTKPCPCIPWIAELCPLRKNLLMGRQKALGLDTDKGHSFLISNLGIIIIHTSQCHVNTN